MCVSISKLILKFNISTYCLLSLFFVTAVGLCVQRPYDERHPVFEPYGPDFYTTGQPVVGDLPLNPNNTNLPNFSNL